jgi:predicted PhzF superfamily epimerase YddE/YHI9
MSTSPRLTVIAAEEPSRMPVIMVSGRMQEFPKRTRSRKVRDFMPNTPLIEEPRTSSLATELV